MGSSNVTVSSSFSIFSSSFKRILFFSVKSFVEEKVVYGENLSSGKNIRHLTRVTSLSPEEVFPDKVTIFAGRLQVFLYTVTSLISAFSD